MFNGSLVAAVALVRQLAGSNDNKMQQDQITNNEIDKKQQLNGSLVSKRSTKQSQDELFTTSVQLDTLNGVLLSSQPPDHSGSAGGAQMLLSDLSRSVEMSISQSHRLDSGATLEPDQTEDKQVEADDDGDSSGPGSDQTADAQDDQVAPAVQFTGAGLAYSYRFEALYLRFGLELRSGSEHRINSRAYPAELQMLAYNSHLYKNFNEASTRPKGLLAISVLVDLLPATAAGSSLATGTGSVGHENDKSSAAPKMAQTAKPNEQLVQLLGHLPAIGHRGSSTPIRDFNVSALLADTDQFVTYEGSLTQPGCYESVTWLVLNRPLYISQQHVSTNRPTCVRRDQLRAVSAVHKLNKPLIGFGMRNMRIFNVFGGAPH